MIDSRATYPDFFRLRQRMPAHRIEDVGAAVADALNGASSNGASLKQKIQPGQSVAIAVGSRGIADLALIVSEVVRYVRDLGGVPMIVPAMGSHGGATAEGQTAMLASLGVDSSVGCPVHSSMETVLVGQSRDGFDIHFDKTASEADHVILINRIKPHTRLTGRYESGLIKMLLIGMGNHVGALLYHQLFGRYQYRLDSLAPDIVATITQRMPVTLGLAIVEDALDNPSLIEAVWPSDFLSREPELLSIARSRMPRLPFDDVKLLIVDTIGKEFSGTGMDTNVIGRKGHDKYPGADETPRVDEIYVRSLSDKTAGNASGIGIAEYCHRRVVDAIDHEVTRINCVTSAHVTAGAIPLTFDSDRQVFDAVLSQVGPSNVKLGTDDSRRWMWIADTLHLGELACSGAYLASAQQREDLEVIGDPRPLRFDTDDNLLPLW